MKRALLLILLVGGFHPIHASLTLDNVIERMQDKSRSIRNIKFSFEQQVKFTEMGGSTTVQGEAVFSKPGRLFIHKKFPEEQITVSNGQKVWVYTPSFNQVWQGLMKNWAGASFLPKGVIPLDNFADDLVKNFRLRLNNHKEDGLWLSAFPKDDSLDFSLELRISTTSWLPLKTVYRSESAEIVTELSEANINTSVADEMFRFQPPKGVEVIPLN